MTITAQFNKVLPTHLAVAFLTALASFSREFGEVTVTFAPAEQDHMELHRVSGKVVFESMWEQPLGEIFSAFDCVPDREDEYPERNEWLRRVRPLATDIITKGGIAALRNILTRAGAPSLSKVSLSKVIGPYRSQVEREMEFLKLSMEVTS